MSCLSVFKCRGCSRPPTDQEVVERDAGVASAARSLAVDMHSLHLVGMARIIIVEMNETLVETRAKARRSKDTLVNRTMELADSASSGAGSRVRLAAVQQILLKNLQKQKFSNCEGGVNEFMLAVRGAACQRAVNRIRERRGDIVKLYNQEARRLTAQGFYSDINVAYWDIRLTNTT